MLELLFLGDPFMYKQGRVICATLIVSKIPQFLLLYNFYPTWQQAYYWVLW